MIGLIDLFQRTLPVIIPLAFGIYLVVTLVMRRRLVHLLEPLHIQIFMFSFAFAGFWPLYDQGSYSWHVLFWGAVLAITPFLLLYRINPQPNREVYVQREALASCLDFKILVYVTCALLSVQAIITIIATGFSIAGGNSLSERLGFLRASGVITYINLAGVNFLPAFLIMTYRSRLFWLVCFAFALNTVQAVFLGSRVGLIQPLTMVGASLFLLKLDANSASGRLYPGLMNLKNLSGGVVIIGLVGAMVAAMGAIMGVAPGDFLNSFLLRLFLGFDGLFLFIDRSLLSPHLVPDYSIVLSYTQPIHKLLQLDVGQLYSHVGEYVGAVVYHLNIWRNADLAHLTFPNSNVVMEIGLSYGFGIGLLLIPLYSLFIICLLNYFERLRYRGLLLFCVAQYFLIDPLRWFADGNHFIVGLYGLAVLVVVAKVGTYLVYELRRFATQEASKPIIPS